MTPEQVEQLGIAPEQPTHIVGIGASAGGLEALLSLLFHLKPTGRIAYVIAQHMAHDGHSTLMVNLLNRSSALQVIQAGAIEKLLPDRVYLIPSGQDGVVENGCIRLQPPFKSNLSTPSVNILLSSIAEESGRCAVGIILSGTGSDGVAGCRAIKARGGITFAQDPEAAVYDGMPSAAIEAGTIDHVFKESEIPNQILARLPGVRVLPMATAMPMAKPVTVAAAPVPTAANPELARLVRMVLDATGIDFSGYKEETLLRRIEKRMAVLSIATMADYFAHIAKNPGELVNLQHLFLVSLSSFFRDRESFSALERELRSIIGSKKPGDAIRFWVPGCASGEEVYTLAIILAEMLGEESARYDISITGTDLNPEALEIAQAGLYRQTAFKEMEHELLERYFLIKGLHCQVNDAIRAMCTFQRQDVVKGEPLRNLDLVSCRNLLIYMKSPLQDALFRKFHQALLPHGLLFIGQSENIGLMGSTLFTAIDHYHRLYRRKT